MDVSNIKEEITIPKLGYNVTHTINNNGKI